MAATIGGTIKVNVLKVNDPKFAGVYTGDFSYDDTHLTKVGEEVMTINGGIGERRGLLSFNFRFLDFATALTPVTYTARDEFTFPDTPVLYFENGIPIQFGLQVIPGNDGGVWGGNNGFMFADPGIFQFVLRNGTIQGEGTVTLDINESPPAPVPENASPFASLLAFLGLGGVNLWRKSKKANN
ncbi:MAG: hypothetical protein JGK17_18940 [Microcoleus sp. PH2017_10_PVI_O_A]|uniref:hypothetical protein n=1 Tax=unclassified Microcoleus TaxID=2642155 RepID=UPI001D9D11D0|nr:MULTISPECIES: hypothetical protein [unclassified Microcoleus]TAE80438.1 MAG: hypothetical protein EAZ83_18320 [Oscillatoriales cyanobacterium]MCC3407631.1 hypothetical protein [Microcoleus sp. PH2017_10_PVI_O_A]MCC3461810.1 hypothetical protein [Microcoleus sp. PH2017_11_PCY_U_A]MCC3480224.1 hypothetical protein [Microcoleus sp. PH2017_12_PCY_D_A]MCC3526590.1 hypothetical protein [Microcoleus sp. PH2017_21_RUC_O_A]